MDELRADRKASHDSADIRQNISVRDTAPTFPNESRTLARNKQRPKPPKSEVTTMKRHWQHVTEKEMHGFMKSNPPRDMSMDSGDIVILPPRRKTERDKEIRDIDSAKKINFSKRVQEMSSGNDPIDETGNGVEDNAIAEDGSMKNERQEEMDDAVKLSRFEGCLLGGAVGDALGAPIEFTKLSSIRAQYGPEGLKDYVPAFGRIGAITDDTQMTLFTAEGLLRAITRYEFKGICAPEMIIYHAYLRWLQTQGHEVDDKTIKSWVYRTDSWLRDLPELNSLRAPGNTCLEALMSGEMGSTENRLNNSKGCGGVMRVAPIGLIANDPFGLAVKAAAITHSHPSGYLSAGVFALIIRQIINGVGLRKAIEHAVFEILPEHEGHEETLIACRRAIDLADKVLSDTSNVPTAEMVESLGGGWVGEEALAIAIFCSLVHENDFEKAIILSVNHSGDGDSTGSMAGNILGALLGIEAIPKRWLDPLELREEIRILAGDLAIGFRNDDEWSKKYPGI
jgi:ADP-ribosylglycohydrolase